MRTFGFCGVRVDAPDFDDPNEDSPAEAALRVFRANLRALPVDKGLQAGETLAQNVNGSFIRRLKEDDELRARVRGVFNEAYLKAKRQFHEGNML